MLHSQQTEAASQSNHQLPLTGRKLILLEVEVKEICSEQKDEGQEMDEDDEVLARSL
jgi:hypothetical protein